MANHITVSSAQAFEQADAPKRSEAEWAEIIRDDLGRAVEGIIAAGKHLRQAKYQLTHGRFLPLLKSIGLHERTAERLMRIAANVVLANPTHGSKLPASMRTLYELSTLPVQLLEAKISDGTITPDIERKDVEQLKRKKSSDDKVEVEVKRTPSLAEQLRAAKAEIERLKARLKSAGGSLFDLANDTAEVIGKILADNMSEGRFDTAVKAAKARYKAKRHRPAG
jgi:hypothetical protein